MKGKTKKIIAAVAMAALLAFSLAACSSTSNVKSSAQVSNGIVKDMKGDDAVKAGSVKTVLTANSVATQMVIMLGGESAAADLGQGFNYADGSLNKSMFKNLGDLKTMTRDDVTVENVAAINPDLVIIDVPDTVAALRAANISAAYMSVTSPETIMEACDMLGATMGGNAEKKALEYHAFYEKQLSEIGAKGEKVTDKPRVIYLRNETKTIGEGSMPDNWITTCGGINVGAELGAKGGAGSDVTTEAIIGSNPDIIVCERPELQQTIMSDAQYADINAVKNGKVYVAPLGTAVWSMGTAEACCMLPWAATIINPDVYKDVDPDKVATEFFKTFYGYTLTADDLNTIFHR